MKVRISLNSRVAHFDVVPIPCPAFGNIFEKDSQKYPRVSLARIRYPGTMPAWEITALGLALLLGGSCSPSAVSSAQPTQQAQVPQPAQFATILIPSPTMERATVTATFAAG